MLAISIAGSFPAAAQTGPSVPQYVGSEVCADCHRNQARAWRGSHHALAWSLPGGTTVLGDFNDSQFRHKDVDSRFTREGEAFMIATQGPDGSMHDYEVLGVVGIEPLQQYLVSTEPGRLQALDIAWDMKGGRWYHLYPDDDLPPGDGLHWSGPYKNWNARCAECHATGFEKSYDLRKRSYKSRQSEIGVGCEACHGPGEAHLAWARKEKSDAFGPAERLTAKGFTIGYTAATPEAEIQQCASCHARRETFLDGNPLPGTPFHDAYRLALLREGLYHADGSIADEVYVYGSFLQSKMYARGVRCTDCHDPHSAGKKVQGNALCTQCHSEAGNARFPTLMKATYNTPEHHFHQAGSEGAQCTSCHMIERVYMGVDGRRDHSFRIPRPDLTADTGAPNACNDCHDDRDSAWAAAEIARRFPDDSRRGRHFAQIFSAARKAPSESTDPLLEIAKADDMPGIVRATALSLLARAPDESLADRAAPLLSNADPLIRAAAVAVQRSASAVIRVQRLIVLLEDPVRAVRIAAAREFLNAPITHLPPRYRTAMNGAMAEWRRSLLVKSDFPETHLVTGGAALVMKNLPAAEAAFREAVRLDPQRVEAWTMLVRIRAAVGDLNGARAVLDEAMALNVSNQALESLAAQFDAAK